MAKVKKRKSDRLTSGSKPARSKRQATRPEYSLTELLATVRANPDDLGAVLTLADYYRRHNQEAKMADLLEPIEPRLSLLSSQQRTMYYALLAYAYAVMNRLLEAERVIENGLAEDASSPDLLYILAYLKLHLKEYDLAIEAGKSYEAALTSLDSVSTAGRFFAVNDAHRSQTRNFVANAYREKRDIQAATEWYEKSITSDPANHLPYLNLATMLLSSGDTKTAGDWTQRGLKNCREIQELRMLAKSLSQRVTISACLIVKDEQKMLPDCLASIRDWVDEIIVVDTGSTDDTVSIAKDYGAKLYHKAWTGDFSAARNYSLEQATGDWILVIDADERFVPEDVPRVRQLLNDDKHKILSINVFNVYGEKEDTTTFLPSIRLFRRALNLRYEGIVHNRLELPPDVPVARAPLRIKHLGYDLSPEQMNRKFLRSKALLEKQLAENPDDVFALFNYAQLLRGEGSDFQRKNAPQILKAAGRAVELTDPRNIQHRHTHLMCLDQIAWTHFYLGNYDLALEFADRALEIKPEYLDPLMLRGHAYGKKRMYKESARAYHKYLETQSAFDPSTETDNIILVHPDSRATAYYGLAMLAELQNDRPSAIRYYLKTIEVNPAYLEANGMLGRVYLTDGRPEEALRYLTIQVQLTPDNYSYHLEMARAFEQLDRVPEAAACYKLALDKNSDDTDTLVAYAEFCTRADLESEIDDLIRAVLSRSGQQSGRLGPLAASCLRAGKYRQAADIYGSLHQRCTLSAEQLNDLANCFFKMGDFQAAEGWYVKAMKSSSPPAVTYRNLGLTQVRLNKIPEATKSLARYAELNPRDMAVVPVLGDLYAKLGKYKEAISFYEKSLMMNPQDTLVLFGLSECYLNMGHIDSAALGYQRVLRLDPGFKPARQRLSVMEASEVKV